LIAAERKRQGLSLNQLSAKAGLSQSMISRLESNPRNPTLSTLLRIADVLELNLGELLKRASASTLAERSAKK
jgi:transcriptional regulator with XRE-family HTH domain